MSASTPTPDPTRHEIFMSWVIESWFVLQPIAVQMAFAMGMENRMQIAKLKADAGVASEPELGAIALAQTFLDEVRTTQNS